MGADFGGGGATSNIMALSSCTKVFLGVGALSLPAAAKLGGIVSFMIFLLFCSYVAAYCIFRLVQCSEVIQHAEAKRNMYRRVIKERKQSGELSEDSFNEKDVQLFDEYPELCLGDVDINEADRFGLLLPTFKEIGACAYGPIGGLVVDVSILITQLGGCVAYTIFISQSMNEVFPSISRSMWLAIMFLPMVLISFVRDISKLAPAATAGNVVYIYTLFVLFYTGFTQYCCAPVSEVNLSDYTEYATIFGTLAFALEGIALILPIKSRMQHPSSFPVVMTSAMSIVFAVYFFVGVFGYLFFGAGTRSPVISNLPPGALSDSVKVALCICLYFSFGMQTIPNSEFWDFFCDAYVFRLNFYRLRKAWNAEHKHDDEPGYYDTHERTPIPPTPAPTDLAELELQKREHDAEEANGAAAPQQEKEISDDELVPQHLRGIRTFVQYFHRTGYVVLCCGVAWVFPQFHLIVALFGSLSNALLAYILPALFYLKICGYLELDGRYWYPFDRRGRPNPYPVIGGENLAPKNNNNNNNDGGERNLLLSSNPPDSAAMGASSPGQYGSHYENDELSTRDLSLQTLKTGDVTKDFANNDSADTSGMNNPMRNPIKMEASAFRIFGMYTFPYIVAVVGTIASAIGVTMAVKDLIAEFGTG